MTSADTQRRAAFPKRLAALGIAAAIAATGFGAASTAVADSPAAAAEQSQRQSIQPINQHQTGLPTADFDCGPASVVHAMLAQGYTPRGWNQGAAQAVANARQDTGQFHGITYSPQLVQALRAQDVPAYFNNDFDSGLAEVRAGKAVIFNGLMSNLPYRYSFGNAPAGHWITVIGYSEQDGTYTVLDSNDGSKRSVTYEGLQRYNSAPNGGFEDHVVVG